MSLYERLGGDAAIGAALDRFYEKVLADGRVSPFFDGVDVDDVKTHQRAFLATAFGGPDGYTGRGLRQAHARPRRQGLDDERFEVFMGHFRSTLDELGVPGPTVDEVMDVAYGGKDDVMGR